jgi:hypothetical protein
VNFVVPVDALIALHTRQLDLAGAAEADRIPWNSAMGPTGHVGEAIHRIPPGQLTKLVDVRFVAAPVRRAGAVTCQSCRRCIGTVLQLTPLEGHATDVNTDRENADHSETRYERSDDGHRATLPATTLLS